MDHIRAAQSGSQEDTLFLINKFEPILKHYSYRLHCEDALNELTLAFIEMLHAVRPDSFRSQEDAVIISYISHAVRNAYIAHLPPKEKRPKQPVSWEGLTEAQQSGVETASREREVQDFQDRLDTCSSLSARERTILTLIYLYGYTSTEIAKKMDTTKQNINQIKLRALKKLKTCQAY